MRVLVAAMPLAGHVAPMTAVAAELVRRGHDVVAYTGAKFGPRFAAVGATWLPWERAPDFEESDLAAGARLADVLDDLGVEPGRRGVAIAVDGEVVPRAEWATTSLPADARVEVVQAIQGG